MSTYSKSITNITGGNPEPESCIQYKIPYFNSRGEEYSCQSVCSNKRVQSDNCIIDKINHLSRKSSLVIATIRSDIEVYLPLHQKNWEEK